MFSDIIKTAKSSGLSDQEHIQNISSMDGLTVCSFLLGSSADPGSLIIPSGRYETFFCTAGGLYTEFSDGSRTRLGAGEIMLLSDTSHLRSACLTHPEIGGILVSADPQKSLSSLETLCSLLGGLEFDTARVGAAMRSQRGCGVISGTPWCDTVFEALSTMNPSTQGKYCAFAAVELLYLLCCSDAVAFKTQLGYSGNMDTFLQTRQYIDEHLDETLTIEILAKKFHLSPTSLKTGFRQVYSIPVHKYIQRVRMEKAASLLKSTPLSILDIAIAVGYSGTSQFVAVFKRTYHMTPSQYRAKHRKILSDSGDLCLKQSETEN